MPSCPKIQLELKYLEFRLKLAIRHAQEKLIHAPGGGSPDNGGCPDRALIKAVARAFEWREVLEKGNAESILELARRADCDEHYIRRLLRLAFLSPKIIEAILNGKQPRGVTLSHILRVDLPLSWRAQREVLGFFAESKA